MWPLPLPDEDAVRQERVSATETETAWIRLRGDAGRPSKTFAAGACASSGTHGVVEDRQGARAAVRRERDGRRVAGAGLESPRAAARLHADEERGANELVFSQQRALARRVSARSPGTSPGPRARASARVVGVMPPALKFPVRADGSLAPKRIQTAAEPPRKKAGDGYGGVGGLKPGVHDGRRTRPMEAQRASVGGSPGRIPEEVDPGGRPCVAGRCGGRRRRAPLLVLMAPWPRAADRVRERRQPALSRASSRQREIASARRSAQGAADRPTAAHRERAALARSAAPRAFFLANVGLSVLRERAHRAAALFFLAELSLDPGRAASSPSLLAAGPRASPSGSRRRSPSPQQRTCRAELRDDARTTSERPAAPSPSRLRGGLVAGQIALLLSLLVFGAGLLVRSPVGDDGRAAPGFDPDQVITAVDLAHPSRSASTPDRCLAFYRALEATRAGPRRASAAPRS